MDAAAVLESLASFGDGDWIALWMIVDDVESELKPDDDEETLEITLTIVEKLLQRGFLAGDSPVTGDAIHFNAWLNQEPSVVAEHVRREWTERGGPPGWGDSPWFARSTDVVRHA